MLTASVNVRQGDRALFQVFFLIFNYVQFDEYILSENI